MAKSRSRGGRAAKALVAAGSDDEDATQSEGEDRRVRGVFEGTDARLHPWDDCVT
jgi:hypothetical protein